MSSSAEAQRYAVTALPFIPFSGTGGEALNNNGVVAGGIANSDGSVSLAVWSQGTLTDLGVPPGLPSRDFSKPRVFGMNDSGAIVGTVHTGVGDLPSRWFVYDRGRFTVLPLAESTDLGGAAIGINRRGQVVGYDRTSNRRLTAWLWSDGVYSRLSVPGIGATALAINSSATIVGNHSPGLLRRLFAGRQRGKGERGYILSRGSARYVAGFVYAINERGDAAGGSTSNGTTKATLFRNGSVTELLNFPSYAVGVNSCAEVVGFYEAGGEARRHLFIWSAGAAAFDLTPDGYVSAEAAAINDRGDVLGYGTTRGGDCGYFLLTRDPAGSLTPRALG